MKKQKKTKKNKKNKKNKKSFFFQYSSMFLITAEDLCFFEIFF